jgi:transposase
MRRRSDPLPAGAGVERVAGAVAEEVRREHDEEDADAGVERQERVLEDLRLRLLNRPAHTSKRSRAALAEREAWLHPVWLSRYSPHLDPKEREWKLLKRDARSHLAKTLREFVDEIVAGLSRLGGGRLDIEDRAPEWFIEGRRKVPTGRPPGRPRGQGLRVPQAPRQELASAYLAPSDA